MTLFGLVAGAYAGFSLGVWGEFRYDSNVFALSDREMDEFFAGDPDFLMSSVDDGIARVGFSAGYRFDRGGVKYTIRASARGAKYFRNSQKDYLAFSGGVSARRGGVVLETQIGGTPRYTTRSYYDPDTDSPQWCSYKFFWIAGKMAKRVIPYLYFGFRFKWGKYIYNDYFPEYDSHRHEFEFSLTKYGAFDLTGGYRFTLSSARGYDTADETYESSDESDISYEQDAFFINADYEFGVSRESAISLDGTFYHRVYTSTKNYWVDPMHIGRDEWVVSVQPGIKHNFSGGVWAKVFLRYVQRWADSEYNPRIPELRSYQRFVVGVGVGKQF